MLTFNEECVFIDKLFFAFIRVCLLKLHWNFNTTRFRNRFQASTCRQTSVIRHNFNFHEVKQNCLLSFKLDLKLEQFIKSGAKYFQIFCYCELFAREKSFAWNFHVIMCNVIKYLLLLYHRFGYFSAQIKSARCTFKSHHELRRLALVLPSRVKNSRLTISTQNSYLFLVNSSK